jgi:hypothetical protein
MPSEPQSPEPAPHERGGAPWGRGFTPELLREAIEASGYPLQGRVVNILPPAWSTHEEWGFRDRNSGVLRALDVHAERWLWLPPSTDLSKAHLRARPSAALLIECKQSTAPYVFFSSQSRPYPGEYPEIVGLRQAEITLSTDGTRNRYLLPVMTALGLSDHEFILSPPSAMAFAKALRKGTSAELTGSDPFVSFVEPLISAAHHHRTVRIPSESAMYVDPTLTLLLGVIDGPMVLSSLDKDGEIQVEETQWVRVVRNEPHDEPSPWRLSKSIAIEFVHIDFFEEFLGAHLEPLLDEFGDRVAQQHEVVYAAEGFAEGLGTSDHRDVFEHLRRCRRRSKIRKG